MDGTSQPAPSGFKFSLGPNQFTILTAGSDTNGRYSLLDAVIAPGDRSRPHRHTRESETFFVVDGTLNVTHGDRCDRLTPGMALTIALGVDQFTANTSGEPTRVLIGHRPAGGAGGVVEMMVRMSRELAELAAASGHSPPFASQWAAPRELVARHWEGAGIVMLDGPTSN